MEAIVRRGTNSFDRFNFGSIFGDFKLAGLEKMRGCGLFSEMLANYSTQETDNDHSIRVSLPGHNKDSVKIHIDGNKLSIEATLTKEGFEAELIEDQSVKFRLPKNCNLNNVNATMEDGILTIVIEKLPEVSDPGPVDIKIN